MSYRQGTLLLHIDGKDVPASDGATFPVFNPATGDRLFDVAAASESDVDDAVAAGKAAFDDARWRGQRGRDRARALNRAAGLLAGRIDELAELETRQVGRTLREMRAQLTRLPEWLEYFAAVAQTFEGTIPEFGRGHLNVVTREPLGVAGLITPWNHPLLITMKKVSAAVAAGNSVVIKPSELGPAVPLLLAGILEEAGVPPGIVNVAPGLGPVAGRALSEHPGLAKLDITGGTETGRLVAAAAGRSLIPVTAELGGKAPVLVFDDVETHTAVAAAMFSGFIATGQTCVQGARLLVARPAYDAVLAQLQDRTEALRVGDPMDPHVQVGPLVSAAQRDRVAAAVEQACSDGARMVCGGAVPEGSAFDRGWFYRPTVLADVTEDMAAWQEEIFGPVVVAMPFDDERDAVTKANNSRFGLAASVWCRDIARALRVVEALDIGIVWVNDHHRVDPASPWGGRKDSGLGSENGVEAYRSYTRAKSAVINTVDDPFDWFAETADVRYS